MTYSKSQVDRAGKLFVDHIRVVVAGRRTVGRQPGEFRHAIEIIDWWREEHARPLSRVAASLRDYASEQGHPVVAQRLKKFPTTLGKLLREPSMKLSRMADIGGVRAVLPNQDAAHKVASRLRKNWTIVRVRDYVAEPKADGYRALHLINRNHGRLIEVQLRTPLQHGWANLVETDARLVAPGLKFGKGPAVLRNYYVAMGKLCADIDQGLAADPALSERVMKLRQRADTFKEGKRLQ